MSAAIGVVDAFLVFAGETFLMDSCRAMSWTLPILSVPAKLVVRLQILQAGKFSPILFHLRLLYAYTLSWKCF